MIYTYRNACRSTTFDVEAGVDLHQVISINTDTGDVVVAKVPLVLNSEGEIDTETLRYHSVCAIHGGMWMAQLFLCFGGVTNGPIHKN